MNRIRILDEITIQKIAAGEVVERPSSIVKELIENSLDADADQITIEIKNGGKSYIRVTDNGNGIDENDLHLAFKPHSTSKLNSIEDLYEIRSLGFRGEALSSISNVSRLEVMTKTINSLAGIQAKVEEGRILSTNMIGCPKGTTMIIKDLFYNLPVRKKFLKSDLVESNKIADVVYKIALGNPGTSFRFIRDDKVTLTTSRNNNLKTHIYSILGKEFSKNLIEVEGEFEAFKIKGYISNNHLYRSNRSHQYIYINGRYIDNISISKSIEKVFRSILPINRFPVFILFMEIDPSSIDVNIHPTKQEIKFENHNEVISSIEEIIKESLKTSISIPKIRFEQKPIKKKKEALPLLFDLKEDSRKIITKDFTTKEQDNLDIYIKDNQNDTQYSIKTPSVKKTHDMEIYPDRHEEGIREILSRLRPLGVIFSTYILAEDTENEKIYFIDQHAAHERVMYEKYLKEYQNENIVVQQLLAPEVVELTSGEMIDFTQNITIYKRLGFEIEEFGDNSIIIRGVPLLFGLPNVKRLFYDILDNIESDIKSSYDLNMNKIMKIACVNSVKSGDYINTMEIISLFEQLKLCESPYTCPHGRPTIIEMTKKDIEKEFLRIT